VRGRTDGAPNPIGDEMRTPTRLGRLFLGLTVVSTIGACSGAAASAPAATPRVTVVTPAPNETPVPDLSGSSDAMLVVGRPGDDRLHVILASTEEEMLSLPLGAPDHEWANVVATTSVGAITRVEDLRAEHGFEGREQTVAGAWRMPTVGLDPVPVGTSANGSTIVLVEAEDATDPATSRFTILDRTLQNPPRAVELVGSFEYDALSPDGSLLYVVEHLPGPPAGHYQVRVVETATGFLRPEVVVDKSNVDEAMAGYPIAQAQRSDGMVFTLYRGTEHPFIHALNSIEAWALCIDLPATGADDADAALDWGLTPAPDGADLLAINATLGLAVQVAPSDGAVRRTITFEPSAAMGITLAKFGHQPSGPVGRRVVAAPDGASIYAAGPGGIIRIDPSDLTVTGRYLEGTAVDAMAVTPDGGTVYALTSAKGRIVELDAASGKIVGRVPTDGFDRLMAVVPY
jgi:DNA-binding beta-propeller fold protein YncE